MRRIIIMAALVLLVGGSSTAAVAGVRADVRHSAKVAYKAAAKRVGKQALGRNIARHGVRTKRGERPATVRELRRWRARLAGLTVAPRYFASRSPAAGSPVSIEVGHSARNTAGLPACADESHGNYSTGPENTNASSGATGRWQTLRSHYAKGGVCEGLDVNDPGGQDKCAALIFEKQGAGAWTACG